MRTSDRADPAWLGESAHQRDGVHHLAGADSVRYPKDGNRIFTSIEEGSFWYRHRNDVILGCLRGCPALSEGVFLEVGAGNGFVSRAIRDSAHLDVACLEPDPDGAAMILRRGISDVVCSPFREGVVALGVLTGMGMFDVLEHVPDENKFLALAKDALKADGKLFITVPAYNWLWSIEDEHDGHIRRYTRRRLVRLLEAAGFIVEYATYFFALLPLPILLCRTIPSLLRLGNKKSAECYRESRAEQSAKDHAAGPGWLGALTNMLFAWELEFVRHRMVLPFGGSIIAVATKRA